MDEENLARFEFEISFGHTLFIVTGSRTLSTLPSGNPFILKHTMMTSSNGNVFRVTGPLWGNPPVTGAFPSQRPVTRNFDVSFDITSPDLNKWLSKQSRRRWFETPSHSLWRQCNAHVLVIHTSSHHYVNVTSLRRLYVISTWWLC